jgi:UDP-glucose 4-epimerase
MLTHSNAVAAAPSRVVILGATGFVGAKLTNRLFEEGVLVLPLSTQDIDLSTQGADKKLSELLLPTDTIVFLSAISRAKGRNGAAFMSNMKMAQAVCAATTIVRPKHLIYASSDAVYPFTQAILTEKSLAAPADLYGAMHRARELLLSTECSIPLGILRFTAIYGGTDTHNSYGPNRFISQALNEKKISLIGNGEETRDHLYIDDAVEVIRRVIACGSSGLLNVASGNCTSFKKVAECIAANCTSISIVLSPRKSPVTHRGFDIAEMLAAFPDIRFTSLNDGLRASLSWKRSLMTTS